MTSRERLENIRAKLEAELPLRLAAEGLANFTKYVVGEPFAIDQSHACAFTIDWSLEPDCEEWTAGVFFQVYLGDDIYAVESCVVPQLVELLRPELVGMTFLDQVESTVFPPQRSSSVSLVCSLAYRRELDDA